MLFFATPAEFRAWLEKNHATEKELVVGFYKVGTKKPSVTWSESVDQALCFGWIDGVRRSVDDESYCIRFTPRKPGSIWSAINIKKMETLTQQGLMQSAGIASFEKRKDVKSKIYSYENDAVELLPAYEKELKANKKAWDFFSKQPPSYQRTVIYAIMTAKQEATRERRFRELIECSEAGLKIKRLRY